MENNPVKRNIEDQEITPSSIYTTNNGMTKANNFSRTTNENFNSSNIMGMGSKIK